MCSVNSTHRSPSLQTRPQTPPANSPRVCAYGANVAAICLFGGKSLPVALLVLAPGTVRADAGLPALGSLRSAVRLRRVHFARTRHATARRRVMPSAVRYVHKLWTVRISHRKPNLRWGLSVEKCFFSSICQHNRIVFQHAELHCTTIRRSG